MFALFLIPCGAVLVLIAGAGKAGGLVNGLGLSLIVAGIVAAFRELVIVKLEAGETADHVATRLHDKLFKNEQSGIRPISSVRRGYDGYYRWAISTQRCELFFAGRSVLHRVQADLNDRRLHSVEEVLLGKLQQSSAIRILFLDPTSDLIPRLSREEGQSKQEMLEDLATSLGICRRLHKLITQSPMLPPTAELHIRVYDEVPHFAYHRQDDDVVVGFYFLSSLGSASAAFQVIDADTQRFFGDHFAAIFDRASKDGCIIELTPNRATPAFNTPFTPNSATFSPPNWDKTNARRSWALTDRGRSPAANPSLNSMAVPYPPAAANTANGRRRPNRSPSACTTHNFSGDEVGNYLPYRPSLSRSGTMSTRMGQ